MLPLTLTDLARPHTVTIEEGRCPVAGGARGARTKNPPSRPLRAHYQDSLTLTDLARPHTGMRPSGPSGL